MKDKKSKWIVLLLIISCVSLTYSSNIADKQSQPHSFSNGYDLVQAMYDVYKGKWYEYLMIKQKVTYHKQGKVDQEEVWTEILQIPGKVRSNIGNPEDGNCEIYLNDTFYIFREGKLIQKRKIIHNVLLLGFDVYRQDIRRTISRLKEVPFDLDSIYSTTWQNRPAYVVGALEGDSVSNQFWIDKASLCLVRLIIKTPREDIIDIELNELERLGGGWIATELLFKRNGNLYIAEEYLDYRILEKVDPEIFNVEDLKTRF